MSDKIFDFDWDDANIEHIAAHQVTPGEAEEACCSLTLILREYDVDHESRYEEIGQTERGRILKIVTTERLGKIRVVTAHDATPKERRQYLESRI